MTSRTLLCFSSLLTLCWSLSASALKPGEPGFNFTLPSLTQSSKQQQLSDFRGNVVYLDFWASWCGPCRKSLPLLDQLHQQLVDQPFIVLGINLDDDPELGRRFLRELGIQFPNLSDASGSSYDNFGVSGMPTSFLIDQQGIVRWVHQGFTVNDMETIRPRITELLKESQ